MDKPNGDLSAEEIVAQGASVEAAVQQAVTEALRAHKRAGHTVVGWRDGQVVWVPPEEIPVDDDPAAG